jgi:hypothetical protein
VLNLFEVSPNLPAAEHGDNQCHNRQNYRMEGVVPILAQPFHSRESDDEQGCHYKTGCVRGFVIELLVNGLTSMTKRALFERRAGFSRL